MANCIHPSNLIKALQNQENLNRKEIKRFGGIQANASVLSHDELNNCGILHQDDFNVMTEEMIFLKNNYGFKIFGGCCGTNEKFIEYMSKKLIQN